MNQNLIQYTIFLIIAIATISMAADNSNMPSNGDSDWVGVVIGVIIPALVSIILVAGIYTWWKRKKHQHGEKNAEHGLRTILRTEPPSTPRGHEQDLSMPDESLWRVDETVGTLEESSLNALMNATHLRENNKIREYYVAISKIIKQYVGAKFDIKVADYTTGEILEALPQSLTETTIDHVGEILRSCDIIEFAQYRPSNADLDHIYQLAVEFIENQIEVVNEDENPEDDDELDEI